MALLKIDPRPTGFNSRWQEYGTIVIACLAQALNQAGSTQVLPMMNELGNVFSNVTSTDKVWFMAAFPLTSGAFILISGKFGDLYGLKKVLICGAIWSAIWTLITGLSGYTDSVILFCICRAMHGIGLAFVLPSAIGVIGTMYPNGQRKALVFSAIGGMAPTGAWMGCLFGGITTQFGHWEWAYYSNAIVFALMGILALMVVPGCERYSPADAGMDWYGSIVGVTGLILFNFATNQAPQAGWGSPYIITLFVIGILLIISFFYIEKKVQWPLLPKEVMNLHTGLILAVVAFGWSSFSIYVFYYWSLLLNLKKYTPIEGGLTYGTFALFGWIAACSVGLFIRKVRPSYLLCAASFGFLVGISMLSCTPVDQTYFNMLLAQMIISSFGMDISFPASSLFLSDSLPKSHQGMASSLVSTMTNYAMSVSLGFAGTAEVHILEKTGDILKSYRAAMYVGAGLASLGCVFALVLHVMSYFWEDKNVDEESVKDELHEMETNES
uniref:MFS transporter n=1 Tax=Cyberlindnera americana TaxID=36016 RepID=A0A5P8N8V8_9ASCO|nr:MFS transporter [Cyberlindnera americana]